MMWLSIFLLPPPNIVLSHANPNGRFLIIYRRKILSPYLYHQLMTTESVQDNLVISKNQETNLIWEDWPIIKETSVALATDSFPNKHCFHSAAFSQKKLNHLNQQFHCLANRTAFQVSRKQTPHSWSSIAQSSSGLVE